MSSPALSVSAGARDRPRPNLWERLRHEAVRRNTLVARGQPDHCESAPARKRVLTPGESLTGRFKEAHFGAVVELDGRLHVLGKEHAGLAVGGREARRGEPKSGWRFWWVEHAGQARRLEAVRDERCRRS